jgi:hypothetical protein
MKRFILLAMLYSTGTFAANTTPSFTPKLQGDLKSNTNNRVSRARANPKELEKHIASKFKIVEHLAEYKLKALFRSDIFNHDYEAIYKQALEAAENEVGIKLTVPPALKMVTQESSNMIGGQYTLNDNTMTLFTGNLHTISALMAIDSAEEVANAVFLIFAHELTHAIQFQVLSGDTPEDLIEGHAALVQDLIAQRYQLYDTQLTGERFYFNFATLMSPVLGITDADTTEETFSHNYGTSTDLLFKIFDQEASASKGHAALWDYLKVSS